MPVEPLPVTFGPLVCADPVAGTRHEWLVPDGLGGFAMGTVSGLRTRRYHALHVVAGDTPGTRHVGLVALDPVLELPSGTSVRLGSHAWSSGALDPQGHRLLARFDLIDGLPRWHWRVGQVLLERRLAMLPGAACLGVTHRVLAGGPVRLQLEALCTWRDAHGERRAGPAPLDCAHSAHGVTVERAYQLTGPGWQPTGHWWLGAYARDEAERGLAATDDLYFAGRFSADLDSGQLMEVTSWAGELPADPPPAREVIAAARVRAGVVLAAAAPADPAAATLALAADAFVVRPGGTGHPDVVAGYPWFGAWSRDTMISYPGLFLATGRAAEGRDLLRGYAGTLSEGMLANTADTGSVEYNTVDGTLWFGQAVRAHVAATGDTDLAAELLPVLESIVAAHLAGTRYGIRADPTDLLLTQGTEGYALTWMDARVDGIGVTPRIGKPVEVNALWINLLGTVRQLRDRLGRPAPGHPGPAGWQDRATASFRRRYPAPTGWLYDVLDGPGGDDARLRPNQIFAYALPDGPLRGTPPPDALGALLTPLGPRTLGPDQPGYRGQHRGGPAERDRAYHQGTVWPWLIGGYAQAQRAAGRPVTGLLDGLLAHLGEAGLGSVSETADGAPPHLPTGCPFQAWSVAETLRAYRALTGPAGGGVDWSDD